MRSKRVEARSGWELELHHTDEKDAWIAIGGLKVHRFGRVWITRKWYDIRCRYGGKETRKRRSEVFGCIPHGRGAFITKRFRMIADPNVYQ